MNGGGTQATQPETIKSIRIQTSTYGAVQPLVYGTARVSGNVIWYGDFRQISHEEGGK